MAEYTQTHGLIKPEADDFYNIDDFNGNMDIIDSLLGGGLRNEAYLTPGTYVFTAPMSTIYKIEVTGGGGYYTGSGINGGAGAYCMDYLALEAGQQFTITVGTGGISGSPVGGASSFGALLTAAGAGGTGSLGGVMPSAGLIRMPGGSSVQYGGAGRNFYGTNTGGGIGTGSYGSSDATPGGVLISWIGYSA